MFGWILIIIGACCIENALGMILVIAGTICLLLPYGRSVKNNEVFDLNETRGHGHER